jgi:DNA invertase Pin-like site-specific DNA recombinase
VKKVICLYRVSTIGQVDHDDIPMQRLACREYAKTHPDWEIIDEISEKGISGYKVSATDRDAIVEIKKRAAQHQFDVLLVFMFDRLGRRDDETPFVVQWFVQQGIEVWSAREGEQRFDDASYEAKHLVIAQLVDRIEIRKNDGYDITIHWRMTAEQFLGRKKEESA